MSEKNKTFENGLDYALRLLNLRPRSEKELSDKLKTKGYSLSAAGEIISRLKKIGLVNDRNFAQAWVSERMRLNPSGIVKLRFELKQKGINSVITEEILSDPQNKRDFRETAREIARKKLNSIKIEDKQKIQRRVYDYLRRRGFSSEIILSVMKEFFKNFESSKI